jgi:zinc protease
LRARWALLASALVCVVPAGAAAGAAERTLANGLKVIVKEDHRSPVAVSMVWYRAGSMDEKSGTTGVAHVLEHIGRPGAMKRVPGRTDSHERG